MIRSAALHANTVAKNLTGRDYISFSAVRTFSQCPLRYYFKYVAGLPEKTVAATLIFGSAIHASVEHHFRELLTGSSAPALNALLEVYRAAWLERSDAHIQFGRDDNVDTLQSLAERMLTAFQTSDAALSHGAIIGVEEELRGPLVDGCPDLLARLDLLVDTGRELVVTDLKTSRSRWNRRRVDESAEQLLLYSELVRNLIPNRTIRLEFAVISKAKKPVVERHVVDPDRNRVHRTKQIVARVWQAIAAGNFYPSPSPLHCPSCPFRGPCRAWTG